METNPGSDPSTSFRSDAQPHSSTVITDSANSASYTYSVENGKAVRVPPPTTPEKDAAIRSTPAPPPQATAATEQTTSGEDVEQDIDAWLRAWDRLQSAIARGRSSTQQ